jgi:hypothetical protein
LPAGGESVTPRKLANKAESNMMRITSKLMLIAAALAAATVQSNAQNTVLKVVQDINFKLTGYYQMSPTENSSTIFRHAGR